MAETPIMPLYTDALLADTAHLSPDEFGAYMRLLVAMWRAPEPCLPNDDSRLARIAGVGPKRWATMWPVLAEFFADDSGKITQKRLLREKDKARRRIEAAKISGSIGGTVNALKNHTPVVANAKNPLKRNGSERGSETVADEQLSIIHNPDKKEEPPISPPAGDKKRRTRLPDNFPNEWCLSAAKDYWLGKGRADLVPEDIAAEFTAYCKANGKTYLDWPSAWQTWYVNAVKFNKPSFAKPAAAVTDWDEVARKFEEREKGTIQ